MQKSGGALVYTISITGPGDQFTRDPFADADDAGHTLRPGVIPSAALIDAWSSFSVITNAALAWQIETFKQPAVIVSGYFTSQPIRITVAGAGGPDIQRVVLHVVAWGAGASHGWAL